MHILDEDLASYLRGRLPSHQLPVFESHLEECSSCASRLSDATEVASHLSMLDDRQVESYKSTKHKRESLISSNEPALIRVFSPFSAETTRIQIMEISSSCLRVCTPHFFGRGTVVQVLGKKVIILGEVQYCVAAGEEFSAGIDVQDVVPRP
jgi:anti-sigma factor RsiW